MRYCTPSGVSCERCCGLAKECKEIGVWAGVPLGGRTTLAVGLIPLNLQSALAVANSTASWPLQSLETGPLLSQKHRVWHRIPSAVCAQRVVHATGHAILCA